MASTTKLNTCLVISIFVLAIESTTFVGKTIYVDADAIGLNNGSSWAHAYNHLQDALADANSSAKPVEIRVAEGIYTPDSNSAVPNGTGDREATFQLINGVTIKGGYAGFGEPDPNARDIELYGTILSGDIGTVEDNSDNSFHVVTGSNTEASAILDGFTITAGNADGGWRHDHGGGMYNYNGSPTVLKCRVRDNKAFYGGGVSNVYGSSPMLTNCTFIGNQAYHGGGGIHYLQSNALITNCSISGNSAWNAGGIWCCDTQSLIINCVISGNTATDYAGGIQFFGSICLVKNSTISCNTAGDMGGGIYFGFGPGPPPPRPPALVAVISSEFSAPNSDGILVIINCILWGDMPDELYVDNGTIAATYSDVQGGWPGDGNIDADPCFADSNNGDYHLLSQRGRYLPMYDLWVLDEVTSPCIDGGDPRFDPTNEPLPDGGVINMGAYGGTAEASMSEKQWIAGDISHDSVVNMVDFAILAGNWLQCEPAPPNYPPQVYITQPEDGAQFYEQETITIRASAWDVDGSVVTVEFFVNDAKIGKDNYGNNGWKIDWDDHPEGSYDLTARATDDDGITTTSPAVQVKVVKHLPPPA